MGADDEANNPAAGARTLLIVDDERHIVAFLSDFFEDEGFTVRRAYDGAAALDHIEHEPPDLVLSDIALPGLNGIELARRLTAEAIPVVLMSAAVIDPRIPNVVFVPKPFALDQILDAVRGLLKPGRPTPT